MVQIVGILVSRGVGEDRNSGGAPRMLTYRRQQWPASRRDESAVKCGRYGQLPVVHVLMFQDTDRSLNLGRRSRQDKLLGRILVGNDEIQLLARQDFLD